MPRYELWSGDSLKFWEFELAGTAVIVRHGDRPARGQPTKAQATTKRFSSPDQARLAYEDLIAAKLGTGKWRPPEPSDRARLRQKKASEPRVRQLEETARKSRRIKIQFALGLPKAVVSVVFDMRGVGHGYQAPLQIDFNSPGCSIGSRPPDLESAFSETQHRYPRAKVLLGKMAVKTWACPLKPRALAQLVTRILAERFETVEVAAEPKVPRAVVAKPAPRPAPKPAPKAAPGASPPAARAPNDWPETDIRLDLLVQRMQFTPDGKYLLMLLGPAQLHTASYAVEIWERGGSEPVRVIKLPRTPGGVECLAVSPDGKYFVSGYQGLRIYELPSARFVGYLEGHRSRNWSSSVLDVAFSPDGHLVASGSRDNTSRLWQFKSRKPIACFPHKTYVSSVCFEPSGQRLVTGCTYQETSEPFADLQSFDFKGARLVRYEPPKGEKHFWSDLLVISPDGRLLVAGCGGGTSASVGAGVWNLKTGRFLRLLSGWRIFGAFDAVFTSDGDFLLTSHIKGIRVWSTKTWKCVSVLEGGERMALTADERFIAYEKEKQVRVRPFVRPRGI